MVGPFKMACFGLRSLRWTPARVERHYSSCTNLLDMHRDPFRLLEAALGRSSGASQRLGRASFTHAATTKLSGPSVEVWCELHVRGGFGHSRSTRRISKLAVGVLSWREPRPLQRSRVQWRARGYQGHQVVALAHSDQGCALVGLCLSMCEVGVRAGGVCG